MEVDPSKVESDTVTVELRMPVAPSMRFATAVNYFHRLYASAVRKKSRCHPHPPRPKSTKSPVFKGVSWVRFPPPMDAFGNMTVGLPGVGLPAGVNATPECSSNQPHPPRNRLESFLCLHSLKQLRRVQFEPGCVGEHDTFGQIIVHNCWESRKPIAIESLRSRIRACELNQASEGNGMRFTRYDRDNFASKRDSCYFYSVD
jgi:hypothetical protein